jgi:tetratricopeptide (TPR) repeat protein
MRGDPVMDFFFQVKEYVSKNQNLLLGVAIIAVFALVFFMVYTQMHGSSIEKATDAAGNAWIALNNRNTDKAIEEFRIVADNHRTTPQGAESAQMLGSTFLNMGRYDDAIKWFEIASTAKNELGFVAGGALEGLANCYEAKGEIPKALDYLEKALHEDQLKFRHPAIRWKMALLNQKINNGIRAQGFCREILSDTLATDYRQRAENLLASLTASKG